MSLWEMRGEIHYSRCHDWKMRKWPSLQMILHLGAVIQMERWYHCSLSSFGLFQVVGARLLLDDVFEAVTEREYAERQSVTHILY